MLGLQMLIAGLSTALPLLSCQGQGIDLDRLVRLNSEARGGPEALQSVQSLRVRLHLVEPGFEADLVYHAMRPRFARADVTMDGKLVFTEAVNDSGAWQQAGGDRSPEQSSPEGTGALRRGAVGNLYGLHELAGLGYRLRLLEPEPIEGILYHPLEVTAPDGDTMVHYVDPETCLVTRRRAVHAVHVDVDPTKRRIESRFSDFRMIGGIVHPFRSEDRDLQTGELLGTTVITDIDLNPPLDATLFAMPQGGAGR